jgi:hypothetical protein
VIAELVDAEGTRLDALPRDRVEIGAEGEFELRGLFGYRKLTLSGNSGNSFAVTGVYVDNRRVDVLMVNSDQHIDQVLIVIRRQR